MDTIMMIMAYILFGLGVIFVVVEIFFNGLEKLTGKRSNGILSWTPVILFIGAAIAKYIAS